MTEKQLPEGWVKVRFGDVAKQCKESIDRENNPFERYIEGGHMDSEDLKIRRFGIFSDDYVGPAFHRVFRKGQILYGSRRTYLKKIAVADFDGITANTTFVVEPVCSDFFYGSLLPYVMLSDSFTSYSILKSKGSTNPYINWSDIEGYEFSVPPLKEQIIVFQIISLIQDNIELSVKSLISYLNFKDSVVENFICNYKDYFSVGDFCCPQLKNGYSPKESIENGNCFSFSISAIRDGLVNITDDSRKSVFVPLALQKEYSINKNDVFIVRGNGNKNMVGLCGLAKNDLSGHIYPDILIKVVVDKSLFLPELFVLIWNSTFVRKQILSIAQTTNGTYKINQKGLSKILFPKIPLDIQKDILNIVDELYLMENCLKEKLGELKNIQKRVMFERIGI